MQRRLHFHGPSTAHREELVQAAWGLVIGSCFAFLPAAVATVVVGMHYGKDAGGLTFVGITLVCAFACAAWSARRAGHD